MELEREVRQAVRASRRPLLLIAISGLASGLVGLLNTGSAWPLGGLLAVAAATFYIVLQRTIDRQDARAQARAGTAFGSQCALANRGLAKGVLVVDHEGIQWSPGASDRSVEPFSFPMEAVTGAVLFGRGILIPRATVGFRTAEGTTVLVLAARLHRAEKHPALAILVARS